MQDHYLHNYWSIYIIVKSLQWLEWIYDPMRFEIT